MSPTWRRELVLAGLLCATLAAAGCGTSVATRDTRYAGQLTTTQQQFAAAVGSVMAGVSPRSPRSAAADAIGRYEAALARIELRLHSIHAPAVVSGLHRHLVKVIGRYGAEVRRMIAALRPPAASTLAASEQRFAAATARLSADVRSTFARISAALARQRAGAPGP